MAEGADAKPTDPMLAVFKDKTVKPIVQTTVGSWPGLPAGCGAARASGASSASSSKKRHFEGKTCEDERVWIELRWD